MQKILKYFVLQQNILQQQFSHIFIFSYCCNYKLKVGPTSE